MRTTHIHILLSLVFLLGGTAFAGEWSGPLQGPTEWRGEIVLSGPLEVPAGVVLTIAAGTVVRPVRPAARLLIRGVLRIDGTKSAPVTFAAPAGWEGIEFQEAEPGSRIIRARFSGAETAVSAVSTSFHLGACDFMDCVTAVKLVRLSNPLIENCRFIGNGIAVDQEMKSEPVLRRNLFRSHRQTAVLATHNSGGRIENNHFEENRRGIALLRQYSGEIAGNRFRGNETAVYCEQTRNTPLVRENSFEKNGVALANISFSSPRVERNQFIGNEAAIRNDQLGSPAVKHNLFQENRTAVACLRRSSPQLEKNLLKNNGVALFCDFSSYPKVSGNNFLGNRMGVQLGANQSSDYEQRFGSRGTVMEKSSVRRGKSAGGGPPLSTIVEDFVDLRGNWWGLDTDRLAAAGPDGNVAIFFDGADRPTVTMEGYGAQLFRLDRVRFHPWLRENVPDAGPGMEDSRMQVR